ncbi:MAG: decarboxylating 6-phosphogluconate dehydrogenase [Pseudomonadales bacterium]|nr:decarboxylating 6-phosphogluconate dehydrogenase [Pseudomonadales bacterium]
MHIAMIGLGKMGGNMVRRLRRRGIEVTGYNRHAEVQQLLANECGMRMAESLEASISDLPSPRIVWLMLPAGGVVDDYLQQLVTLLAPGDIVVEGANSNYKDSQRRFQTMKSAGIHFVDVGVSGGVWGLENGYALMIGGEQAVVETLQPLFATLAPTTNDGWLHCGPAGSGHFVKMIHNGIEYGMMQAYAEGFSLMKGKTEFELDLAAIAEMWRHGSVVRSWLLDLSVDFLSQDQTLEGVVPVVADSGEGRWTAMEAIEQGVPSPVMSLALMMRFASQGQSAFSDKILAKMRQGFGGHALHGDQKEGAK